MKWSGLFFCAVMIGLASCAQIQSMLQPSAPDRAGIEWITQAPGLEWTQLSGPGALPGRVTMLRISPAMNRFQVHYRAGDPLTSAEWRAELPAAAALMNANFFDDEGLALGWLVQDGNPLVAANPRFGGAFIEDQGNMRVVAHPADAANVRQATQGFPTLVRAGNVARRLDAVTLARRSVIAEDRQGRIYWIQIGGLGSTLAGLANWLVEQPLALVNAVNMDGGGSSFLLLSAVEELQIHSWDAVPAVWAIYPQNR